VPHEKYLLFRISNVDIRILSRQSFRLHKEEVSSFRKEKFFLRWLFFCLILCIISLLFCVMARYSVAYQHLTGHVVMLFE